LVILVEIEDILCI